MFELDDKTVEDIEFAMENQETDASINVKTGEIRFKTEDSRFDASNAGEADGEEPDGSGAEDRYESLPGWTSQDGFRLMELFVQSVGNPVARSDLMAALSRGRGVFRSFKNALEAHPDVERKWFEYKARAMKARIVEWYENLREVLGLERLGLEPEETDDLLVSDFRITRCGRDCWKDLESLFAEGFQDARGRFPEVYVDYEHKRLREEMEKSPEGEFSVYAAESEASVWEGAAILRTLRAAERSFGKLVYLYVRPERRKLGLGRALMGLARDDAFRAGILHFIVDVPFLGEEFGNSLESLGYKPYGARWLSVSDA